MFAWSVWSSINSCLIMLTQPNAFGQNVAYSMHKVSPFKQTTHITFFIKYLNYFVTWVKEGVILTFYPKAQRRVSRSPKGPLPAGKTNSFSLLCTCDYGCTMSVYSVHMIWTHRLSALRAELWLTVCYFSFSHHLRIRKLQIQIIQAAMSTLLYRTSTKTFIIKSYQSCLIIKHSLRVDSHTLIST